jgi:hypothetical protein
VVRKTPGEVYEFIINVTLESSGESDQRGAICPEFMPGASHAAILHFLIPSPSCMGWVTNTIVSAETKS